MELFSSKYKPYLLEEFHLDDDTLFVLKTLAEMDDLNILITGNICCGKTTLLYALIREYYGLKKHDPIPNDNILFLNNLKEQGIQYYRNETKIFCQSMTVVPNKKKIIIIDDLEFMNDQNQKVFRGYMDNYKSQVHFITACSNIQKIIDSFQSRLHIIELPTPSRTQMCKVMDMILKNEHMEITPDAYEYILTITNSSIRTLINYLEKLYILGDFITLDLCKQMCYSLSVLLLEEYIGYIKKKQLAEAIHLIMELHRSGYSVIDIFDHLFTFIKQTQMLDDEMKYKIIPILCKYITIFHNIHEDNIELIFFTNQVIATIDEGGGTGVISDWHEHTNATCGGGGSGTGGGGVG